MRRLERSLTRCLAALMGFAIAIAFAAGSLAETKPARSELVKRRFTVRNTAAGGATKITIVSKDGRVRWRDVIGGLVAAEGLDAKALKHALPNGDFPVTTFGAAASLLGLNVALHGAVTFEVVRDSSPPTLEIIVRRDAARDRLRQFKSVVRQRVLRWKGAAESYSLSLDPDWSEESTAPLAIVLHGYTGRPGSLAALRDRLRENGIKTGAFGYPNDGSLESSGRQFSFALEDLARRAPGRKIQIIAHSMGGLVARVAIELEEPGRTGNVERLITVATPHQGSSLARIPFSMDAWEAIVQHPDAQLTDFFADGLNEARDDLRPNSKLMRTLQSAERRDDVRYTVIAGNVGLVREADLDGLRDRVRRGQDRFQVLKVLGPRLNQRLADLDEIVDGKGDGVVSVRRARLANVEDTIVLPFRHWTLTDQLEDYPTLARKVIERAR